MKVEYKLQKKEKNTNARLGTIIYGDKSYER